MHFPNDGMWKVLCSSLLSPCHYLAGKLATFESLYLVVVAEHIARGFAVLSI
jgi:hypothetical protein